MTHFSYMIVDSKTFVRSDISAIFGPLVSGFISLILKDLKLT